MLTTADFGLMLLPTQTPATVPPPRPRHPEVLPEGQAGAPPAGGKGREGGVESPREPAVAGGGCASGAFVGGT